ncbi:hypothetical protein [Streptomyces misionensis]|uniref:hypothetical protein n=1 Tax=Streptomyces misionensis TaxID=67331 RepID=UPI0036B0DA85
MPFVESADLKAGEAAYNFVQQNEYIIRQTLGVYIEYMTECGKIALKHFQEGQDDSEVRARQDAGVMTNRAFKIMAEQFQANANSGTRALESLGKVTDPDMREEHED